MKTRYAVALAMIAGIGTALGVHGLQAQTKPSVYVVGLRRSIFQPLRLQLRRANTRYCSYAVNSNDNELRVLLADLMRCDVFW
jgi:hypothetical protein